MNLKDFELFVFDLDGTLVDSSEDIANAANFARDQLQLPPLPRQRIDQFVGRGVVRLMEDVFETEDPALLKKALALFLSHYHQNLLTHTTLFPGVREFLEQWQDRKMAVLTNKQLDPSEEILKGLGVRPFFGHVVGGDSAFPKKPDPEGLLWIIDQESVTPEKTVFFGDSLVDWHAAQNANVTGVLLTQGFGHIEDFKKAGCSNIFESFNDL